MKIYNTLTRKVEELVPLQSKTVHMFVCGPTVYDFIHIGNARTFVIFDMVAKYLRFREFEVRYIQNITDIDDKIISCARENNEDAEIYAQRFETEYFKDIKSLGIDAVSIYVRATDHIEAIIKQVQTLIDKGFAYEISDGIYFDISKFKGYGKLSGRTTVNDDDAVSRIDENPGKRNSGDFALWKRSEGDEPSWQAPWFPGRPGWHIEDTAITEAYFGPQYDLHGGGRDLIFPHHEAEITQQEAASGKSPFVKYWMHAGFLENKSAKMSKSLDNFATVRDMLERYPREVLRLYFLSAHYRSPLDFSEESFRQAQASIDRITEFINRLKFFENKNPNAHRFDEEVGNAANKTYAGIIDALDDDFNTPKALGIFFEFIRLSNQYIHEEKIDFHFAKRIMHVLDIFSNVFGIIPLATSVIPLEITQLVQERQSAKEHKDFEKADQLRRKVETQGYLIDDTPYGPLIKKR
ncbi:MAG: cysteine--tRNA ligase [Patescibacteria group bacterium]